MERQVKQYIEYKRKIRFQLSSAGLWPVAVDAQSQRWFKSFLGFCSAFASCASFCAIFAFCLEHATSIGTWTRCLGMLIGFFFAFVKICILAGHEEKLRDLNEGISASFERNLEVPESRKHLLLHFPIIAKFFYFFRYFGPITIVLLAVTPLTLARHGKYVRMFPYALPFTYEPGGVAHWLLYVFELLSGFYLWSVNSGADSAFGLYALHMVGELRLLAIRYKNLKATSNYKADLKECVIRHLLIVKSRRLLEEIFGLMTVCHVVTCAVALCGLVFQATKITEISVKIGYLICHCLIKLMQALSYAWYGNILAVESEDCLMAIYDAYWPESGDTRFMSDVMMVMLQKPLIFRAMGFMDLRLDTFLKIVHTTLSYFFLLKTLEEKS